MKAGVPYDATEYIDDAISEVLRTLTETLLIVIVVIFLFLGSFRAVIIPIVAIPISLIGAVFLMLAAGFTINLLTLLAIVLAVGLVVDDAIVMVENVERHLHAGMPPVQAALTAARELVGPIVAMTITLAAVYAPVGIQGGLTGALFREFAFTLAGAVIVSGVVALTLSPMMAGRLLRTGDTTRGFAGWINRRFDTRPPGLQAHACRHAAVSPRGARALGDRRPAHGAVLHAVAAGARAGGGPGCGVFHHPGIPERDHRSDDAVHAAGARRLSRAAGGGQHLPDHVPHRRVSADSSPSRGASARRPHRSC